MTSANSWTTSRAPLNISVRTTAISFYLIEFEKLGTYVLDFTAALQHATLVDGGGQPEVFSGTGRTIFHVGPIADLEVRDGGASLEVPSARRAFTVEAVNNGPDSAHGVVVNLSQGGVVQQTWQVGTLRPGQSRTLALPTNASEGAEATFIIDNTAPYTVCIGSNSADLDHDNRDDCEADTTNGGDWHEGTVFDYLDSNNTATIQARTGLAGDAPDTAPALVQSIATGPQAKMVTWSEPKSGSNHPDHGPVRSWDIEYREDEGVRWMPLVHRHNGFNGYRFVIDGEAKPG